MRCATLAVILLACAPPSSDRTQLPPPRGDAVLSRRDTIPSEIAKLYGESFVDTLVDVRPTVVRCPPVTYPETLRRAAVQGQVVVALIVDTLGHPEPSSLRAVKSPHDSLSIAALQAVQGCEFTAARLRGRAVRVLIQLPLDFKIHPS
jgi:TonB family protein